MRSIPVVLCSVLMLTVSNTWATNIPVFGIVLIPPNTELDSDTNQCKGMTIDRTLQIMQEYAIEIDVICLPAPRFHQYFAQGKIDFTINTKSNTFLVNRVTFIEPPFRKMKLNLYSRTPLLDPKTIAAIEGFNYGGYRERLVEQDYNFLDLPSAASSLQAFIRNRSDKVLFYHPQMDYYAKKGLITLNDSINVEELSEIATHFAIANDSPHYESISIALTDYATKNSNRFYIEQ